ncbi:MAG: ribosomal protein S18-alanine N-acetyltransferase [Chloroflexi bacterium]|nr:ribosomal protein S18-alanine N-acetyltransferase [Chloroflexota bacterium]
MRVEDIPQVQAIERHSFSLPWPAHAYRREIESNRLAHYIVLELPGHEPLEPPASTWLDGLRRLTRQLAEATPVREPAPIGGYAGLWLMVDEAHITTIAVHPKLRGHGLGEVLLVAMFDIAEAIGARWLTLEVRVTNFVAQRLYRKYGFSEQGVRKRYYSDNGEDAQIMWSEALDDPDYHRRLAELRQALQRRLGSVELRPLAGRDAVPLDRGG